MLRTTSVHPCAGMKFFLAFQITGWATAKRKLIKTWTDLSLALYFRVKMNKVMEKPPHKPWHQPCSTLNTSSNPGHWTNKWSSLSACKQNEQLHPCYLAAYVLCVCSEPSPRVQSSTIGQPPVSQWAACTGSVRFRFIVPEEDLSSQTRTDRDNS